MKAKINIAGDFGNFERTLLPGASTFDLFESLLEDESDGFEMTTAENNTCGGPEDPGQKLILNWQPDSEIVLFFKQQNVRSVTYCSNFVW